MQKLTCSWGEYLTVVQRLLVQTLREGTHFAILTKNAETQTAKLWFIMVRPCSSSSSGCGRRVETRITGMEA